MTLKSPLGRALGHGAAGSGTGHWITQRLTAVALIPLTLWFAISLLQLPSLDYYTVEAWVSRPLQAVLVLSLLVALIWHSSLGVQVVVEDYVHGTGRRVALLAVLRLLHWVLFIAGAWAVLVISTGAGS